MQQRRLGPHRSTLHATYGPVCHGRVLAIGGMRAPLMVGMAGQFLVMVSAARDCIHRGTAVGDDGIASKLGDEWPLGG